MFEFEHCSTTCPHNHHCHCPFECGAWVFGDGCEEHYPLNEDDEDRYR